MVVVSERDDGPALFEAAAVGMGDVRTLAVGDRIWAETLLRLTDAVAPERVVTGSGLVNELRRTKSPEELEVMERACRVCDDAMAVVAPKVLPGATMLQLVEELEHSMRLLGSRVPSFTTHVFTSFVGGKNSAEESHSELIEEGDVVMFDFGAVVDGYCSDFGRTVCVGEPEPQVRDAYELVLAAQEAGRAALRPGVPASEVNRACRQPIEDGGHGSSFKHRMGHGIGLDVHERPFVSEEDDTLLESGMTFTDEPSILVDGRFGVRIEDVVVCEAGGGRKLNALPARPHRQRVSGAAERVDRPASSTLRLARRPRQAHVDRVERVEDCSAKVLRRREDLRRLNQREVRTGLIEPLLDLSVHRRAGGVAGRDPRPCGEPLERPDPSPSATRPACRRARPA